jgi:threonine synthase
MSFVTELVCDQCRATYSHRAPVLLCPQCGGGLDPRYDIESLPKAVTLEEILERRPGVWR